MVPPHGGIPDPRETGSQPGLVSPIRRPSPVWGVDVEGRGYRHRWREKRTQGESTQRTAVPTRVRGERRRSPITHIRRRLAACAWKHGEAGLTRQPPRLGGAAHARHVRDRGVGISPTRRVRRVETQHVRAIRLPQARENALIKGIFARESARDGSAFRPCSIKKKIRCL